MQEIVIEPTKGIELIVEGKYEKGDDSVGLSPSFIIESILPMDEEICIVDLLQWANNKEKGKILEYIEEMCLDKIN